MDTRAGFQAVVMSTMAWNGYSREELNIQP